EGNAGSPDNFSFSFGGLSAGYSTPRHRHNFEQVRLQMLGDFDYARCGFMRAGSVGYFPEGTPYGPSAASNDTRGLLLQFGGPSGQGYLSEDEQVSMIRELRKSGEFSEGSYIATGASGKSKAKDAYEAVWEAVHGRPLVYPKSRYRDPVIMTPDRFRWA